MVKGGSGMMLSVEELAKKYNVTLNKEIVEVANENGPERGSREVIASRRY